jgi:hydrogenase maturation factor
MANDMATTGFAPQYAQFVLNLPATLSQSDFHTYWGHIHRFCKEIGVAITGGHTGFIEGQNSTIAGGGTFITVAPKEQVLLSKNAQVGNSILVTKQCALSSTAILALSFPATIKNKLGAETSQLAGELFYQTSSLKDGLIAAGEAQKYTNITAMHDVTEGGVLGAIYELAVASGKGALVDNNRLPIGEIQQQVCNLFSLDARYCIGAGAMVVCCTKGTEWQVVERLAVQGIACCVVGEIREKEMGINLLQNGVETPMPYFEEDPYWAAFFNVYDTGWK